MNFTRDGHPIGLHKTIYVVFARHKNGPRRRNFLSGAPKELTIYEMNVSEHHSEVTFDIYGNPMDAFRAGGMSWDTTGPKPTGVGDENARYYFDVVATPLNSFAIKEEAEKALPEFLQRGFTVYNGVGYYADFSRNEHEDAREESF